MNYSNMMDVLRLMTDFGLLVLIWMVQLIIYPGFVFVSMKHFVHWHKRYMMLITFIVAPLMFLQAGLVAVQVILQGRWADWASLLLVIVLWLLTFLLAVPLHNRLGQPDTHEEVTEKLVAVNWYRTICWSALWAISFSVYLW